MTTNKPITNKTIPNKPIMVIKYGGSILQQAESQRLFFEELATLHAQGIRLILVHGGGPLISQLSQRLGLTPQFVQGLRVTDRETAEVAEMVLAGTMNKQLVQLLQQAGIPAVGLCGKDGRLIHVRKKWVNGMDLGQVGEVASIDPQLLTLLPEQGFVPVIAPIAGDESGQTYNINADEVAAAIAEALGAQHLIFLTDVPGIFGGPPNSDKSTDTILSSLDHEEGLRRIENGSIRGGMIPKTQCAIHAVQQGVAFVHIMDGRIQGQLTRCLSGRDNAGTTFYLKSPTDLTPRQEILSHSYSPLI